MLKFHIIIIKFSIFTDKNSQSDTFFPNLKNSIVKIDIKSFSVQAHRGLEDYITKQCLYNSFMLSLSLKIVNEDKSVKFEDI